MINVETRPPISSIIPNKYNVLKRLGRGRFSDVLLVENKDLRRLSALKLIRKGVIGLIEPEIEARVQEMCAHPGVVKLLAHYELPDGVVLELEYMESGSLADRLFKGFLPVGRSVEYLKQILSALAELHDHGIVHRDVSAENIMLSKETAKLSDFGTALHLGSGKMASDYIYGPLAPPEAISHDSFSAASDVYAAGVTLLRAVNNLHSFHSILSEARRHDDPERNLADIIRFADYVPHRLRQIIRKAVSPRPEHRYTSASTFLSDLNKLHPVRDWQQIRPDVWRCHLNGTEEVAGISSGLCFGTFYTVGGRCRSQRIYGSLTAARSKLNEIVAGTTFQR